MFAISCYLQEPHNLVILKEIFFKKDQILERHEPTVISFSGIYNSYVC